MICCSVWLQYRLLTVEIKTVEIPDFLYSASTTCLLLHVFSQLSVVLYSQWSTRVISSYWFLGQWNLKLAGNLCGLKLLWEASPCSQLLNLRHHTPQLNSLKLGIAWSFREKLWETHTARGAQRIKKLTEHTTASFVMGASKPLWESSPCGSSITVDAVFKKFLLWGQKLPWLHPYLPG